MHLYPVHYPHGMHLKQAYKAVDAALLRALWLLTSVLLASDAWRHCEDPLPATQ